jgi:hypothetical protein
MIKLEKIMKDRDVTVTTKSKIVETMIFPIVTYRSESWTVRKKERKKIDAFELRTWRRMLQYMNNYSTKTMVLWTCNENKRKTGMGHNDRTG